MATTVTKTIKSSGGDYTSLSAWEAAQQGDLTGIRDEIAQAECYKFLDTTAVDITGWTTDATRYIRIYTPTAERHAGYLVTDGSAYCLQAPAASAQCLRDRQAFTRIEGLILDGVNCTNGRVLHAGYTVAGNQYSYNVIKGIAANSIGIEFDQGVAGNYYVFNNIIYDSFRGVLMYTGTYYIENNTVVDCGQGIRGVVAAQTYNLTNNISFNNSGGDFLQSAGTFVATYNSSSDATADDWGGAGNLINKNSSTNFIDYANNKFGITSADTTQWKNLGTATVVGGYTDDIIGTTRDASWDIGAYEVAQAAGVTTEYVGPIYAQGHSPMIGRRYV